MLQITVSFWKEPEGLLCLGALIKLNCILVVKECDKLLDPLKNTSIITGSMFRTFQYKKYLIKDKLTLYDDNPFSIVVVSIRTKNLKF